MLNVSSSGGTVAPPDAENFPLPPNTLPSQTPGYAQHLNANANATMHDISSLFNDLSTHAPMESALHESTDQFAARLRALLVQERHQFEHMTTTITPGLPLGPPLRTPRRMLSQPSPMRGPKYEVPGMGPVQDSGNPQQPSFFGGGGYGPMGPQGHGNGGSGRGGGAPGHYGPPGGYMQSTVSVGWHLNSKRWRLLT